MTYRNIFVHVDSSAGAKARVAAASSLAVRFKCPLTGGFVYSSKVPRYVVADAITPISQGVLDAYRAEQAEAISKASGLAKDVFMASLADKAIHTRWLDVDLETDNQMLATAKRHDLVILPSEIKPSFSEHVIPAEAVGMASGGPVIVLKHGGFPVPFGKKILIAWKETREAMRAVRDAWPFLEAAEEIHILRVSRDAPNELDASMLRLFQDHGCPTPQLHVDRNDDAPVEGLIRLHAGRTGADLIVLGLYCHSRVRELVMGGVSRGLLADPPMPLFLSH